MKQEFYTFIGYGFGIFIHNQDVSEYSVGIIVNKEIAIKISFGTKYILVGYIAKYEKD